MRGRGRRGVLKKSLTISKARFLAEYRVNAEKVGERVTDMGKLITSL